MLYLRQNLAAEYSTANNMSYMMEKLGMSARATRRFMKMARTDADLEESQNIREQDLLEAIAYRRCQIIRSLLR